MAYGDLVHAGQGLLHEGYPWLLLGLAVLVAAYILIERLVMRRRQAREA